MDEAAALASEARKSSRCSIRIEAVMRKAMALHALGDVDGSFAAARAGIGMGLDHGFVHSLDVPGFDTAALFDPVFRELPDGPELLQRLRRRRETGDAATMVLTPRELEIMKRVAAGESNLEIADALFISANTVRNHLVKAFRRLDAGSRSEAVFRARELGLLD